MSEPIRVFIGTEPAQKLPTEVLKHSILSRTDRPVTFTELSALDCGIESRFFTGFSFYRWYVPWFCDFSGRALYLDADILCLCDLDELWSLDMSNSAFLARKTPDGRGAYTSVMLINCARAQWDAHAWARRAAADKTFYRKIMWCAARGRTAGQDAAPQRDGWGDLPACFNALDEYRPGETKLLHFTRIDTQPWRCSGHRFGRIFHEALYAALEADLDPRPYLDSGAASEGLSSETRIIIESFVEKKERENAQ